MVAVVARVLGLQLAPGQVGERRRPRARGRAEQLRAGVVGHLCAQSGVVLVAGGVAGGVVAHGAAQGTVARTHHGAPRACTRENI